MDRLFTAPEPEAGICESLHGNDCRAVARGLRTEDRGLKTEYRMMRAELKNPKSEIRNPKSAHAFSLIEMLMAVGILAVGMLFIAGVFPVSIHFTTVSSERTIAANVADEAFAKIKLYGVNPLTLSDAGQTPFEVIVPSAADSEFAYPSTPTTDPNSKKYWWTALCRKADSNPLSRDVQVTVFVSRKTGIMSSYLTPSGTTDSARPRAVSIGFTPVAPTPTYELALSLNDRMFISDGYTIVENTTGQICRVLDRTDNPTGGVIKIDRPWSSATGGNMWVVPPSGWGNPFVPNGRYPCIAVYQKVIRF